MPIPPGEMLGGARPVVVPRWIPIALGELGVVEDTRPGQSNGRIEEYHAMTRAGRAHDDVAWCASFVSWVLEQSGIRSTRNKAAASYLSWGEECRDYTPPFGAVLVFGKRDKDAKGSGHVGFCLGVSGPTVFLLGGNQGDRVSIAPRMLADVVAMRWPAAVQAPSARPPGNSG